MVELENDKPTVIALREIADDTVNLDDLEESLMRGQQKHIDVDEEADEDEEFLAVEDALSTLGTETDSSAKSDVSDDPLARALADSAFADANSDEDNVTQNNASEE